MSLAFKRLFSGSIVMVALFGGIAAAEANGHHNGGSTPAPPATPHPSASSSHGAPPARQPDPAHYKFGQRTEAGFQVLFIEGAPEKEGVLVYQCNDAHACGIWMIHGIKAQPGAGEALKRKFLELHKPKVVRSELASVNRDRFLKAWADKFPNRPSIDVLMKDVPAMAIKGYHYEISGPPVQAGGGHVHQKIAMTMTPSSDHETTTVSFANEGSLDAMALAGHDRHGNPH